MNAVSDISDACFVLFGGLAFARPHYSFPMCAQQRMERSINNASVLHTEVSLVC